MQVWKAILIECNDQAICLNADMNQGKLTFNQLWKFDDRLWLDKKSQAKLPISFAIKEEKEREIR